MKTIKWTKVCYEPFSGRYFMCLSSADLKDKIDKINVLLSDDNFDMNFNAIFEILGLPKIMMHGYLPISYKIKSVKIGEPIEDHDSPSRGPVYPLIYEEKE